MAASKSLQPIGVRLGLFVCANYSSQSIECQKVENGGKIITWFFRLFLFPECWLSALLLRTTESSYSSRYKLQLYLVTTDSQHSGNKFSTNVAWGDSRLEKPNDGIS